MPSGWRIGCYKAGFPQFSHTRGKKKKKSRLLKDRQPQEDIPPPTSQPPPHMMCCQCASSSCSRAGCDKYLCILSSGRFCFLLSSPSSRYLSCQNIRSPDDKNTPQKSSGVRCPGRLQHTEGQRCPQSLPRAAPNN